MRVKQQGGQAGDPGREPGTASPRDSCVRLDVDGLDPVIRPEGELQPGLHEMAPVQQGQRDDQVPVVDVLNQIPHPFAAIISETRQSLEELDVERLVAWRPP